MKSSCKPVSFWLAWVVWGCAAAFYGFQFLLRVSPSVIAQDLMTTLAIDACTLGTLTSFYYYGYAVMQIPAGLILDRVGPRRPLIFACLLCTVGCVVFGFAEGIPLLSLGRALMGIGSAFAFLGCVKLASLYFKARLLSVVVGLTLSLGTVGATLGDAPLGALVKAYDWRLANYILAGVSLIIALLVGFFVKDFSTSAPGAESSSRLSTPMATPVAANTSLKPAEKSPLLQKLLEGPLAGLLKILRKPQAWIYGGYGFAMYVPLAGFADLWGTPFLSETYNIDATQAAGIKSFFYVGLGIGAPLWSYYMTRLKSYKKGLLRSAILGTLFLSLTLYVPLPLQMMSPFLFISGFAVAGQFAAFAAVSSLNDPSETATSSGLHNMLCMMSGIVMQPLIGWILDLCKAGDAFCSTHYTAEHFLKALLSVPLSLALAILFAFLMKESFPRDA